MPGVELATEVVSDLRTWGTAMYYVHIKYYFLTAILPPVFGFFGLWFFLSKFNLAMRGGNNAILSMLGTQPLQGQWGLLFDPQHLFSAMHMCDQMKSCNFAGGQISPWNSAWGSPGSWAPPPSVSQSPLRLGDLQSIGGSGPLVYINPT